MFISLHENNHLNLRVFNLNLWLLLKGLRAVFGGWAGPVFSVHHLFLPHIQTDLLFFFKNVVIFSRKQQVAQDVFNNLFCIVQHTGGWMGTMDRYTDAVEYLTKKDDKTVKSLRSRMNGCRRTRERDRTVQRSDPDTSVIKKPPERCVSCKSLYWLWQQCGLAGATSGPGCGVLLSLYFGGL